MVSVLLDAGAGDAWKYQEASSDQTFSRSEGLGVCSTALNMLGPWALFFLIDYISIAQQFSYMYDLETISSMSKELSCLSSGLW